MKKAQDIADTTFGNAADQTRMATTLKRAAGMVRSAVSEGVFDEKERKTLLDAIAILDRGVKIRRQAATLKSQKEEADAARRKEIGAHLAETFGAIETIAEKVAFVAAVERRRRSRHIEEPANDVARFERAKLHVRGKRATTDRRPHVKGHQRTLVADEVGNRLIVTVVARSHQIRQVLPADFVISVCVVNLDQFEGWWVHEGCR